MKKILFTYLVIFGVCLVNAQKKSPPKKAKDTIKTEVINVITSYTPKISDAFKIKKTPTIKLDKDSKKRALEYTIFSAPVASTFIPKSGVLKGIDLGKKERLYRNYLAGGFGSNTTPFGELFLHYNSKFDFDIGLFAKYISSENPIESTPLQSGFSNFEAGFFFLKEERYFDIKIQLNSEQKKYNWYGLPNYTFTQPTINAIAEEQSYNSFNVTTEFLLHDSYIQSSSISLGIFRDLYDSSEFLIQLKPNFKFPLGRINRFLDDIHVNTKLEFLKGDFVKEYTSNTQIKYTIFTAGINPYYLLDWNDFSIKAGLKTYLSLDTENSSTNFLIYPDVHVSYPLVKDYLNVYVAANGDLHTNTYQDLVADNPYVSPTLFITQTNEKYSFNGGFAGKLSTHTSFDFKASYKNEQDKALFLRNNSKSDGTNTNFNATSLLGYEFGNSYKVLYDDVITLSFFGEIEIDLSKKITVGFNGKVNSYTVSNNSTAWNLPEFEGTFFTRYKNYKWYFGLDAFIVGDRSVINYNGANNNSFTTKKLTSYVDVNLNGGYHFSDKLSAFIKMNNISDNKYQRFSNFNNQGFQILGGVAYKFDF
ncbi:hypothetical protein OD91_2210 [Lutibacter sp. Hel_I_33_5]|uniref:TonB-dependent receptor n=1 Tax=Lutibacter sp. Hel_I_33_5 TaxID=1566289 RepID=UPI0011A8D7F4|nr:TonB-dependent receptor [Lutibacter sp. Hel_I_33_5]TVZ56908.1 hypothetical protein OD91_2210 [Lutibacter sp. Hel_I_33_5]